MLDWQRGPPGSGPGGLLDPVLSSYSLPLGRDLAAAALDTTELVVRWEGQRVDAHPHVRAIAQHHY